MNSLVTTSLPVPQYDESQKECRAGSSNRGTSRAAPGSLSSNSAFFSCPLLWGSRSLCSSARLNTPPAHFLSSWRFRRLFCPLCAPRRGLGSAPPGGSPPVWPTVVRIESHNLCRINLLLFLFLRELKAVILYFCPNRRCFIYCTLLMSWSKFGG